MFHEQARQGSKLQPQLGPLVYARLWRPAGLLLSVGPRLAPRRGPIADAPAHSVACAVTVSVMVSGVTFSSVGRSTDGDPAAGLALAVRSAAGAPGWLRPRGRRFEPLAHEFRWRRATVPGRTTPPTGLFNDRADLPECPW
jgi:hypothetical protein